MKLDRKEQFFLFRFAKPIGWTLTGIAILVMFIGAIQMLVNSLDLFKYMKELNSTNSPDEVARMKKLSGDIVNALNPYWTILGGEIFFFISRILANGLMLARGINDHKKGILESKSIFTTRLVYYPIIIVVEILALIILLIISNNYLGDTINGVQAGFQYLHDNTETINNDPNEANKIIEAMIEKSKFVKENESLFRDFVKATLEESGPVNEIANQIVQTFITFSLSGLVYFIVFYVLIGIWSLVDIGYGIFIIIARNV